MMGFNRAVALAILPLIPLVLANCSKTDDESGVRDIFGSTPFIESAQIETATQSSFCDVLPNGTTMTQAWDWTLPNQLGESRVISPGPFVVGANHTQITITTTITDADSTPGTSDDILAVTITYLNKEGDTDQTLILLDDGSTTTFDFQQLGIAQLNCSVDIFGTVSCQQFSDFILTTGDGAQNDGVFTRKIVATNLTTANINGSQQVRDCLGIVTGQVPIEPKAGEVLEFRLDVVDRSGNIATWPDLLSTTIAPTVFTCSGDDCLCCWLVNGVDPPGGGPCAGLTGLVDPVNDPDGFCVK